MTSEGETSFGEVSEREFAIVTAVADVLQPEESQSAGVILSLENGRRVWRMRQSGITFVLHGDYAQGSGRCVVPTRMLDEARHISAVNPAAELKARSGKVSVEFGAHRVQMSAGENVDEVVDISNFRISAIVSLSGVFHSLLTATQIPAMGEEVDCQSRPRAMQIAIDENSLELSMDWRPHALESVSSLPAITDGGHWRTAVGLGSMQLLNRALAAIQNLRHAELPSEVLFELGDPSDDWMRVAGGDLEFFVARVPFGVEAALPAIRRVLSKELDVDTILVDRMTVELEYEGEQISCEVFDGDDHRVRTTSLVMALPEGWKKAELSILREINGHNESHLGSRAFLEECSVYVDYVHVLHPDSLALMPQVVTGIVAGIAQLRETINCALLLRNTDEEV